MAKPPINPVTIRDAEGKSKLVIMRLHVQGSSDEGWRKWVAIVLCDETGDVTDTAGIKVNEDILLSVLGHLFPKGELANLHLYDSPLSTKLAVPRELRPDVAKELIATVLREVMGVDATDAENTAAGAVIQFDADGKRIMH